MIVGTVDCSSRHNMKVETYIGFMNRFAIGDYNAKKYGIYTFSLIDLCRSHYDILYKTYPLFSESLMS